MRGEDRTIGRHDGGRETPTRANNGDENMSYIEETRTILATDHAITNKHKAYWLADSPLTERAANGRLSPKAFADELAERHGQERDDGRRY